jgi:hypothetical protein
MTGKNTMENVNVLLDQDVDGLDVVFGEEPADFV